jgi:hypothetical protein
MEVNMSKYISAEDNLMKYDKGAIVVYGSIYADGTPAILIKGAEDDTPVATATVNIEDSSLAMRVVAIKNWSENEGVLETLMNADIIDPMMAVQMNRVKIHYVYVADDSIIQEIKEASEKRSAA